MTKSLEESMTDLPSILHKIKNTVRASLDMHTTGPEDYSDIDWADRARMHDILKYVREAFLALGLDERGNLLNDSNKYTVECSTITENATKTAPLPSSIDQGSGSGAASTSTPVKATSLCSEDGPTRL